MKYPILRKAVFGFLLVLATTSAYGQIQMLSAEQLVDQKLTWGEKVGDVQVSLSIGKPQKDFPKDAITVAVYVKNVGTQPKITAIFAPFGGMVFYSIDENGKQIPISPQGASAGAFNEFIVIPAGVAYAVVVPLSPKVINAAKRGLIAAMKTWSEGGSDMSFKFSNKITVPSN